MAAQPNKNGYVKTRVNDTEFTIKDRQQGSDASAVARRFTKDDRVLSVFVDFDGSIRLHVSSDETFAFGINHMGEDLLPDGWYIDDVLVHESGDAAAHVEIKQE